MLDLRDPIVFYTVTWGHILKEESVKEFFNTTMKHSINHKTSSK